MDSPINALAIAPEGEEKYLHPLRNIPGIHLQTVAHLREADARQSQLIILLASSCSLINQWLIQLRGKIGLSLLPLLAIVPEDGLGPYQVLADEVSLLPLSLTQAKPKLDRLLKLHQQINTLPPLTAALTPHEGQLSNLLRHLMTRGNKPLIPRRFLDSKLGYAYPLVAAFLNTPLGEEMPYLDELELWGYFKGSGHDRLHLCPACSHYQLNFREVCPKCQLPHINQEANLHHYSCAYIAPESEFIKGHQLVCPKCQRYLRHIGVDYDKPSVSYKCQRCQHIFPEAVVNCLCIHCGKSFPPEQARLTEVKEYHLTLAGMQAAQAGGIQQTPKRPAIHSAWETVSYSVFEEMFRLQLWISKRLHRPLSLTALKMDEGEERLSSQGTERLINLLRKSLRQTDLISQPTEGQFLILSPETDRERAKLAMQRVSSQMSHQPRLKIAIAQLPEEGEELKQLTAKLLG